MANRLVFVFLSLVVSNWSLAQTARDSIAATDSVAGLSRHIVMDTARSQKDSASPSLHRIRPTLGKAKKDSLSLSNASLPVVVAGPKAQNTQEEDAAIWRSALLANPWFNFFSKPRRLEEEIHEVHSYDSIFYLIVGLLFYFALVKTLFGKYLGNLLTLFFGPPCVSNRSENKSFNCPYPPLL